MKNMKKLILSFAVILLACGSVFAQTDLYATVFFGSFDSYGNYNASKSAFYTNGELTEIFSGECDYAQIMCDQANLLDQSELPQNEIIDGKSHVWYLLDANNGITNTKWGPDLIAEANEREQFAILRLVEFTYSLYTFEDAGSIQYTAIRTDDTLKIANGDCSDNIATCRYSTICSFTRNYSEDNVNYCDNILKNFAGNNYFDGNIFNYWATENDEAFWTPGYAESMPSENLALVKKSINYTVKFDTQYFDTYTNETNLDSYYITDNSTWPSLLLEYTTSSGWYTANSWKMSFGIYDRYLNTPSDILYNLDNADILKLFTEEQKIQLTPTYTYSGGSNSLTTASIYNNSSISSDNFIIEGNVVRNNENGGLIESFAIKTLFKNYYSGEAQIPNDVSKGYLTEWFSIKTADDSKANLFIEYTDSEGKLHITSTVDGSESEPGFLMVDKNIQKSTSSAYLTSFGNKLTWTGNFGTQYIAYTDEDGMVTTGYAANCLSDDGCNETYNKYDLNEENSGFPANGAMQSLYTYYVDKQGSDDPSKWVVWNKDSTYTKSYNFESVELYAAVSIFINNNGEDTTFIAWDDYENSRTVYYRCAGNYKDNLALCMTSANETTISEAIVPYSFENGKIYYWKEPFGSTYLGVTSLSYGGNFERDSIVIQPTYSVTDNLTTTPQKDWKDYYWNGDDFDIASKEDIDMPTILYYGNGKFSITNIWTPTLEFTTNNDSYYKLKDVQEWILEHAETLISQNGIVEFVASLDKDHFGYAPLSVKKTSINAEGFNRPISVKTKFKYEEYEQGANDPEPYVYSLDINASVTPVKPGNSFLTTNIPRQEISYQGSSITINVSDEGVDKFVLAYRCYDPDYAEQCMPPSDSTYNGHIAIIVNNNTELAKINEIPLSEIVDISILPIKEYDFAYDMSSGIIFPINGSLPTKYSITDSVAFPTVVAEDGSKVKYWMGKSEYLDSYAILKFTKDEDDYPVAWIANTSRGKMTLQADGTDDIGAEPRPEPFKFLFNDEVNQLVDWNVRPSGSTTKLSVNSQDGSIELPAVDGITLDVSAHVNSFEITSAYCGDQELDIIGTDSIAGTITVTGNCEKIEVSGFANQITWGNEYIATIDKDGIINSVSYKQATYDEDSGDEIEEWIKETDKSKFAEILPPKYSYSDSKFIYYSYEYYDLSQNYIRNMWEGYSDAPVSPMAYTQKDVTPLLRSFRTAATSDIDHSERKSLYNDADLAAAGILNRFTSDPFDFYESYEEVLPSITVKKNGSYYKTNSWILTPFWEAGVDSEFGDNSEPVTTYSDMRTEAMKLLNPAYSLEFQATILTGDEYLTKSEFNVELKSENLKDQGIYYTISDFRDEKFVAEDITNLPTTNNYLYINPKEGESSLPFTIIYKLFDKNDNLIYTDTYSDRSGGILMDDSYARVELYAQGGSLEFVYDGYSETILAHVNENGKIIGALYLQGCHTEQGEGYYDEDGEWVDGDDVEICPEPESIALTDLPKAIEFTADKEFTYWRDPQIPEDIWNGYDPDADYSGNHTYYMSERPLSISYEYKAVSGSNTYTQNSAGWYSETAGAYKTTFVSNKSYNFNPIQEESLPTFFFPGEDDAFRKTSAWNVAVDNDGDEIADTESSLVTDAEELGEYLQNNLSVEDIEATQHVILTAATTDESVVEFNTYVDIQVNIPENYQLAITSTIYEESEDVVYKDTATTAMKFSFPKSLKFEFNWVGYVETTLPTLAYKTISVHNVEGPITKFDIDYPIVIGDTIAEIVLMEGEFYTISFQKILDFNRDRTETLYQIRTNFIDNEGNASLGDVLASDPDRGMPLTKTTVDALPGMFTENTEEDHSSIFWFEYNKEDRSLNLWNGYTEEMTFDRDAVFNKGVLTYDFGESEWENVYWNGDNFNLFEDSEVPTVIYQDNDGTYKKNDKWKLVIGTSSSTATTDASVLLDILKANANSQYVQNNFKFMPSNIAPAPEHDPADDAEDFNITASVNPSLAGLSITGTIFEENDFSVSVTANAEEAGEDEPSYIEINIPKLSAITIGTEGDGKKLLVTTYDENYDYETFVIESGDEISLTEEVILLDIESAEFTITYNNPNDIEDVEEIESAFGKIYELSDAEYAESYTAKQTEKISFPRKASLQACFIGWDLIAETEHRFEIRADENGEFIWDPSQLPEGVNEATVFRNVYATPIFDEEETCNIAVDLTSDSEYGIMWSVTDEEGNELVATKESEEGDVTQTLELPKLDGLTYNITVETSELESIEYITWNEATISEEGTFTVNELAGTGALAAFIKPAYYTVSWYKQVTSEIPEDPEAEPETEKVLVYKAITTVVSTDDEEETFYELLYAYDGEGNEIDIEDLPESYFWDETKEHMYYWEYVAGDGTPHSWRAGTKYSSNVNYDLIEVEGYTHFVVEDIPEDITVSSIVSPEINFAQALEQSITKLPASGEWTLSYSNENIKVLAYTDGIYEDISIADGVFTQPAYADSIIIYTADSKVTHTITYEMGDEAFVQDEAFTTEFTEGSSVTFPNVARVSDGAKLVGWTFKDADGEFAGRTNAEEGFVKKWFAANVKSNVTLTPVYHEKAAYSIVQIEVTTEPTDAPALWYVTTAAEDTLEIVDGIINIPALNGAMLHYYVTSNNEKIALLRASFNNDEIDAEENIVESDFLLDVLENAKNILSAKFLNNTIEWLVDGEVKYKATINEDYEVTAIYEAIDGDFTEIETLPDEYGWDEDAMYYWSYTDSDNIERSWNKEMVLKGDDTFTRAEVEGYTAFVLESGLTGVSISATVVPEITYSSVLESTTEKAPAAETWTVADAPEDMFVLASIDGNYERVDFTDGSFTSPAGADSIILYTATDASHAIKYNMGNEAFVQDEEFTAEFTEGDIVTFPNVARVSDGAKLVGWIFKDANGEFAGRVNVNDGVAKEWFTAGIASEVTLSPVYDRIATYDIVKIEITTDPEDAPASWRITTLAGDTLEIIDGKINVPALAQAMLHYNVTSNDEGMSLLMANFNGDEILATNNTVAEDFLLSVEKNELSATFFGNSILWLVDKDIKYKATLNEEGKVLAVYEVDGEELIEIDGSSLPKADILEGYFEKDSLVAWVADKNDQKLFWTAFDKDATYEASIYQKQVTDLSLIDFKKNETSVSELTADSNFFWNGIKFDIKNIEQEMLPTAIFLSEDGTYKTANSWLLLNENEEYMEIFSTRGILDFALFHSKFINANGMNLVLDIEHAESFNMEIALDKADSVIAKCSILDSTYTFTIVNGQSNLPQCQEISFFPVDGDTVKIALGNDTLALAAGEVLEIPEGTKNLGVTGSGKKPIPDEYSITSVTIKNSGTAVHITANADIKASNPVVMNMQIFRDDTLFLDTLLAKDVTSGDYSLEYYPLPAGKYYAMAILDGSEGKDTTLTDEWDVETNFIVNAGQTWQMVSLAAIDSSFDYANSNSTFYYWDEEKPVGEYWQYQRLDSNSEIDSTRGYWFFAEDSIALPINAVMAKAESGTISWELKNRYSGWNMIANPYSWNIYLGRSEGFGDAENEDEPFWRWNATTASYEPVDTLEAFAAIWAFTEKDTVLSIASNPVFSTATDSAKVATKKALTKASSKNSWAIRLVLEGENGVKDAWNVVGVGAREVNIQEPPAGFDGSVNLAIERGNLALAKSIKASSNDATWKLSMQASKLQNGKIHAEGLEKLEELGLKAVLVMDGREMDMHSEEDIDVTLGALAKSAELRVVPTAAIAIAGIQNVRYNVEGSKLHVSFDLDEARGMADVRLVDSDGQVISLAREKAVSGTNSFALNTPKNSGIYFLRITNGKSARNIRFKF